MFMRVFMLRMSMLVRVLRVPMFHLAIDSSIQPLERKECQTEPPDEHKHEYHGQAPAFGLR